MAVPTGVSSFQLRESSGGVTVRVHKSSEDRAGDTGNYGGLTGALVTTAFR